LSQSQGACEENGSQPQKCIQSEPHLEL
jgi:hypothetical protein